MFTSVFLDFGFSRTETFESIIRQEYPREKKDFLERGASKQSLSEVGGEELLSHFLEQCGA